MLYPFQRKNFPTGQTWVVSSFRAPRDLAEVGYDENLFLARDLAGRILVSADGETWEAGESGVLNDLHGV
ncbi:MAG: hypothetical protein NTY64_24575, partial [Deltaproteobacteria bacterium]|nr:hypothetical protein [Deltaproteobacteria bacterium]